MGNIIIKIIVNLRGKLIAKLIEDAAFAYLCDFATHN